jgi:hypothetical protein
VVATLGIYEEKSPNSPKTKELGAAHKATIEANADFSRNDPAM